MSNLGRGRAESTRRGGSRLRERDGRAARPDGSVWPAGWTAVGRTAVRSGLAQPDPDPGLVRPMRGGKGECGGHGGPGPDRATGLSRPLSTSGLRRWPGPPNLCRPRRPRRTHHRGRRTRGARTSSPQQQILGRAARLSPGPPSRARPPSRAGRPRSGWGGTGLKAPGRRVCRAHKEARHSSHRHHHRRGPARRAARRRVTPRSRA